MIGANIRDLHSLTNKSCYDLLPAQVFGNTYKSQVEVHHSHREGRRADTANAARRGCGNNELH